MKLNMGGYLKLGSAGGIAGVFITDPSEPEPVVPNNALVDENGNYILDENNNFIIVE